ncbi:MAG: cation:proton antiporter, partial [Thermoanaerobaculia bacterium]|nr:cation:proton antiporter [Thermoanaerobaculia bacterium]
MILDTVVLAIVLGIASQVGAERLRIPAILPLLSVGILAGPGFLGLIHPDHLGEGLEVIVHVGVAVILFEGGLSLDLGQLSRVGVAVRNLLTAGALITTLGAAALAHYMAGVSWELSLLFGAMVMVTGPTVIAPLLRHMVVPRKVKVILTSEGLIIDAIGATAAYFVLLWVERSGLPLGTLGGEVLKLAVVGVILGFAGGSLCRLIVRRRFVSGEVQNLAILSLLLLVYWAAENQAPQSGILASVVMGVTLSAGDLPDLSKVKVFKGQLTTFLISFVFVLLAAQLDLPAIGDLGWRGAAITAALILVVRPLAVFLTVPSSQCDVKERWVLALTAPRGIVAAAVASLAAISLRS